MKHCLMQFLIAASLMIALQQMLLQTEPSSGKIHLCPAANNKVSST